MIRVRTTPMFTTISFFGAKRVPALASAVHYLWAVPLGADAPMRLLTLIESVHNAGLRGI